MKYDFYSEKHNLRWLHIAKNGMTSIRRSGLGFKWTPVSQIGRSCTVFCVLRHPYRRAISSYLHVRRYLRRKPYARLDQMRHIPRDVYEAIAGIINKRSINAYLSEIERAGPFNGHSCSQMHFLTLDKRNRSLDLIDVYLNLANINRGISKLIGRPTKLPVVNTCKKSDKFKARKHFKKFRKRVQQIYRDDFLLFENVEFG